MVTDGSVGLDVCGCVDVCILTWVLGLYFDRSMGLYFDGVVVLVLVSMQTQVVWGLIVGFLCKLL